MKLSDWKKQFATIDGIIMSKRIILSLERNSEQADIFHLKLVPNTT
jgi:hypothetical protein